MTHILVKSFNRAYYLDRCLQSIQQFVEGDYQIVVLDDGTPKKYLDKIKEKFPEVEIRLSEQYDQKIQAIQENLVSGKEIDGFQIPISLWKKAVEESSDYLIMTEDDVWLTEKINIDELVNSMRKYQMVLLKLGWVSQREIQSKKNELNEYLIGIQPKVFSAPKWFLKNIVFEKKWKIYSIMYRLGIVNSSTVSEYWVMNALLMGLYERNYWLKLWHSLETKVDEQEQLLNAVDWYRKNKRENLYGKLNFEMMKTTFQSSATNSYHRYGDNFDVNRFNHIMNESWLLNEFDSMENFPSDFSINYITSFLEKNEHEKTSPKAWLDWTEKFKNQYRKQQVDVD